MAKAAGATFSFVKFFDLNKGDRFNTLDHELRNPVAFFHRERRCCVGVVQQAGNLASISSVNKSWRIEARNAMVSGKPTSRSPSRQK